MTSNAEKAMAGVAPQMENRRATCPTCRQSIKRARSYDQHKRYFALMKALLFHWPENHPRQFPNETALRKWLQMKAGHYTSKSVDLYGIPATKAQLIVQSALEGAAPYSESVVQGRHLVTFTPVSISYDTLGHKEFCALNDAVDAVIRAETGLDPDQVLRETEKAA